VTPDGRVLSGALPTSTSEHAVQLFDMLETLSDAISTFLAAGYAKGDNLLVVAKPRHWAAISARLESRGCSVHTAIERGKLVVLDAAATLGQIERGGFPDRRLFDCVLGAAVRRLASTASLRIYGEMVEVLAEKGDLGAALFLEELWNELATDHSFNLVCGYSSAHFAAPATEEALRRICRGHTRINKQSDDPLGAWLLATAQLC
jgi:hypothetical protein